MNAHTLVGKLTHIQDCIVLANGAFLLVDASTTRRRATNARLRVRICVLPSRAGADTLGVLKEEASFTGQRPGHIVLPKFTGGAALCAKFASAIDAILALFGKETIGAR